MNVGERRLLLPDLLSFQLPSNYAADLISSWWVVDTPNTPLMDLRKADMSTKTIILSLAEPWHESSINVFLSADFDVYYCVVVVRQCMLFQRADEWVLIAQNNKPELF